MRTRTVASVAPHRFPSVRRGRARRAERDDRRRRVRNALAAAGPDALGDSLVALPARYEAWIVSQDASIANIPGASRQATARLIASARLASIRPSAVSKPRRGYPEFPRKIFQTPAVSIFHAENFRADVRGSYIARSRGRSARHSEVARGQGAHRRSKGWVSIGSGARAPIPAQSMASVRPLRPGSSLCSRRSAPTD